MHKMTMELYFHESLSPNDVANYFGLMCERIEADIRQVYNNPDTWEEPMVDEVVEHQADPEDDCPGGFYVRSRYTHAKAPDETFAANGPAW